MRITFALPGLPGMVGGLRVVAQYAAHLEAQGHQVTLAVRRPAPDLGRRLKLLSMLRLWSPYPPLSEERGYFSDIKAPIIHLNERRHVCADDLPDADAIISTWWTTAEWAEKLPASKGRHIHFVQGDEDFRPAFSQQVQAVYRQSNPKIVVAGWLQDMFRQKYGQESTLVMNGVDTAQFSAPPREKNSPHRVGLLWSPHPHKNCPLALEAIVKLRTLHPNLQAIVFGGEKRPESFPDWITYEQRPAQTRISEIYASCDLWFFTTIREGFGLPLLEAMACRTPVLATPAGAAPDLIRNCVNGCLVSANITGETLAAEADAFLAQSAETWVKMSDAAWQTAQKHKLDHAARAFEDAVAQLVQR